MADRIQKTKKVIDLETGTITISFPSSEGAEDIVVRAADLPEVNQMRSMFHGLSQKLGDATAGAEVAECYDRVKAVADALMDPDGWGRVASAAGPRTTQLAEALAAVTGKSIEEAAGVVNDLDEEQKKELRANSQIKAQLAQIKAAAAAKAAEKAAQEAASGEASDLSAILG